LPDTLEAWIELLFRRQRQFVWWAAGVFGLVAFLSMLCPPVFKSTAEILVQGDRQQMPVSSAIEVTQQTQQGIAISSPEEEEMNSEIELLTSSYLIEQTVADLKPNKASLGERLIEALSDTINLPSDLYNSLHNGPTPSPKQLWAEKLQRHLECTLMKRSNVIEITFASHNARWSRDFLARLLDHYLELRGQISHDPQAERFFNHQAELLRTRLAGSQEQLRALEIRTGIIDIDEQQKALVNQLTDFQAEYSKNQSELAGTNEQIVYLNTEIQKYPERIETDAKTVQNLALQTLKPEVLQLEAERAELLSRYLPDSKRIQSIDAKLNAARALLQGESTRDIQEVSTSVNPIWQGLSNSLAQAKVQETTLQASQSELALQIKLLQQQLKVLADNSVEIQRLRQQVETDKEIYLSYSLKGEEARAAEALNLNRILNANIAQPPTTPVEPSFPSTTINLIAGFMFACAFAFGVVYVAEMRDPKVYSREMASQVSGVPTVAVITLFPNE
jgi:uncharacterized protein involved in exopolysaccharide biosynthesis